MSNGTYRTARAPILAVILLTAAASGLAADAAPAHHTVPLADGSEPSWPWMMCLAVSTALLAFMIIRTAGLKQRLAHFRLRIRCDLDKHHRAESDNRLLALAINTVSEAVMVTDKAGRIIRVNPAFTMLTGYPADEVLGHTPRILKSGRQSDSFYRQMWETITAGQVWSGCVVNKRKDDTLYHAYLQVSPVRQETGEVTGYVGTQRDISENIEREEALVQAIRQADAAARSKSEFLANVSHEIRTPMNGIIGMTQLALETELTGEQREFLGTIKRSADTLLTIINDLLDFSRIEAGRLTLQTVGFSLRDCLDTAIKPLALRAMEKDLALTCRVPPEVPDALVGDPGRLRQVVVHLVNNALKFTEHGLVAVQVRLDTETADQLVLHLSVRDTGVGIPKDQLDRIFAPFEQGDGSSTRKYGGTGLGLAISSRLVRMMGGRIWAESRLGQGSTFHFTACFAPDHRTRDWPDPIESCDLTDVPVLVADGNGERRRALIGRLEGWGARPTPADRGPAALQAVHEAFQADRPFRLALLDSDLPDIDGFALADRIKQDPKSADMPVILLASAGQRGDADRCRRIGIAAYLTRPVGESELAAAIAAAMNRGSDRGFRRSLITRHWLRQRRRRLRILVVDHNPEDQETIRRMLDKQGHAVCQAAGRQQALDTLQLKSFDLVLATFETDEPNWLRRPVADCKHRAGRRSKIPIVAMTARATKYDRERYAAAGVDGYLVKPIRQTKLVELLDRLFRDPGREEARFDGKCGKRVSKRVAGAESDGAQTPVLDKGGTLANFQDDPGMVGEVAGMFLDHCAEQLAEIERAIEQDDATALARAAYAIKGAVSHFCAPPASEAALQLENIARSGDLAEAKQALADLTERIEQLKPALAELAGRSDRHLILPATTTIEN